MKHKMSAKTTKAGGKVPPSTTPKKEMKTSRPMAKKVLAKPGETRAKLGDHFARDR